MSLEFIEKVQELLKAGETFAIATVVKTDGSSSARAGAKAIIKADGTTLFGWVGGGCVESNVAQEALDSLKDGKTRLLKLDLTDELGGIGMPCGGAMQVYIEPQLVKPELVIVGHGAIAEASARFGALAGFRVVVDDMTATKDRYPTVDSLITTDMDYTGFPAGPNSFVLITTQHKGDDKAARAALKQNAKYIALIASKTRAHLVFQTLQDQGVKQEALSTISSPAGLDIGAVTPEEIALSVIAEMIAVRKGASGRPLHEIKGTHQALAGGNGAQDSASSPNAPANAPAVKPTREGPSCG